jgi:hypothetical protein
MNLLRVRVEFRKEKREGHEFTRADKLSQTRSRFSA